MEFIQIILTIIVPIAAIIGAGLSIFNTYQNWKSAKPDIKIDTDFKIIYDSWPNNNEIKEGYDTIIVANKGMKTITLANGYIQDFKGVWQTILERLHLKPYTKIRKAEIFNSEKGVELSSWKNHELRIDYFYEIDPIFGNPHHRKEKVKLIIVFFDQVGNEFKSKPFDY